MWCIYDLKKKPLSVFLTKMYIMVMAVLLIFLIEIEVFKAEKTLFG